MNGESQQYYSSSMRRPPFSHKLIRRHWTERMENCNGSHHPWGGNVYSKLNSFSRIPTSLRRHWMNEKTATESYHHPWGGNVCSKLRLLFSHTYRNKKELNEWKIATERNIHPWGGHVLVLNWSVSRAECREQPMHEKEVSRVLFRSWKVLGSYSYSLFWDLLWSQFQSCDRV